MSGLGGVYGSGVLTPGEDTGVWGNRGAGVGGRGSTCSPFAPDEAGVGEGSEEATCPLVAPDGAGVEGVGDVGSGM